MKLHTRLIYGFLLLLLLPGLSSGVLAEVSCEGEECDWLIILGITEEPDPVIWEDFDGNSLNDLNPGGDGRGDGPPDFAIDVLSGGPVAVWAYNLGSSREIAFAQWGADGWTPTRLLTTDADQDSAPAIFGEPDGRLRVVWSRTVAGIETIWMIERAPGADEWTDSWQLTPAGRLPSIAVLGRTLTVAYERDVVGGGREVVIHTRGKGVAPTTQVIATTDRDERLDVQVHVNHETVWVDWKHSDTQFGYSEHSVDEGWAAEPALVPWTDPSWIGAETVRREIRLRF